MPKIHDGKDIAFFEESAQLLSAMANAARIVMLHHIVDKEISVGALCEKAQLAQSATSQHLAKLRAAGLVGTRREAQTIFYSSKSEAVRKILAVLQKIAEEDPTRVDLVA